MLKIFGQKNIFAIGYRFFEKENMDGSIQLWVDNRELCLFKVIGEEGIEEHEGDLFYISEWLCEHIEYILGYDPCPLPIQGDTLLELLEKANDYESDDYMDEELWHRAKIRWMQNHSWFSSRDGVVFPCVYFWRYDKNIMEISWDNIFWREYDILFCAEYGSMKIEYDYFRKTLLEFIKSILKDMALRGEDLDNIKSLSEIIQSLEK